MNLKSLALSLALGVGFLFSTTAISSENGTTLQERTFNEWTARNVCWFESCAWRAFSISMDRDKLIFIDYTDTGSSSMFFSSLTIPDRIVNSWINDTDEVKIEYRVDRMPIITSEAFRILDRNDKAVQTHVKSQDFTILLQEMKRGQFLRVRTHVNQETFVDTFSLQGLSAALRYIEKKQPQSASPESFFEDGRI